MPARIAVHLEAANGRRPVPPPQTGPAVHATVLAAMRDHGSAEFATALHEAGPPKPYALTPLLGEDDRVATADSGSVRFEIGVLAERLAAPILQALVDTTDVRIALCAYRVAAVDMIKAEPYSELVTAARPRTSWTLEIRTPVSFATSREDGARRDRTLPEPEWVFDSLLNRWNALSDGVFLPNGVRAAVHHHLEAIPLRLEAAEHLVKAGQPPRRGSVGAITYHLADQKNVPAEDRAGLDALVQFASYAGIGDRTAVGMGHVLPGAGVRYRSPLLVSSCSRT